jgi:hypothetical protein
MFECETIWKFNSNVLAMKKITVQDFEDLLQVGVKHNNRWEIVLTGKIQCTIAVFEGLFPPLHDEIIHELLFELATWHRFAKLCLHTELSICTLEALTMWLGSDLWCFESVTCEAFDTWELPSEEAAWGWQMAALAKKQGPSWGHVARSSDVASMTPKKRKRKRKFNLSTYKLHVLGDYVEAIQAYDTTDNYNMQLVSDAPHNL